MRILMLLAMLPWPANNGSTVRNFNLLRPLSRRHEVTAICLTTDDRMAGVEELRRRVPEARIIPVPHRPRGSRVARILLNLPSPAPFHVEEYRVPEFAGRVREITATEHFDVVHVEQLMMTQYLDHLQVPIPAIFDTMGSTAVYWWRYQRVTPFPQRLYVLWNWWRSRRYEADAVRRFCAVVAISNTERPDFEPLIPPGTRLATVFASVDTAPLAALPEPPAGSRVVIFTGSLDWLPNIDALTSFCADAWPGVLARVPEAEFWIVGRDPTPTVLGLARETPGVRLLPNVPSTLPLLEQASVFVVPIRTGAGVKLKTLEALASGRAVVSTRLGAEGWEVVDGEHLLIAGEPQELTDAVVRALEDESLRLRIGAAGRALARERYDAEVVARQMEELYRAIAR